MAKKYTEIGELRESENEDGTKSLYIKIFIKDKDGKSATISNGDSLKLEDPKLKFQRMIDSGKVDDVDKVTEQMNNIPTYVKRRVTLVQER